MSKTDNPNDKKPRSGLEHVAALPFVETIVFAVVGGIITLVDKTEWAAALISFGLGLALSFARLSFQIGLRESIAPVNELVGVVDLERKISNTHFLELFHLYLSINNTEFLSVKESIIEEATSHLSELAKRGRSRELPTGAYYKWLFGMLEAQHGGEIWAVSTGNPLEWTDSPAEKKFVKLNQDAVNRGAVLRRVFIVNKAGRDALLKIPAISWHFAGGSNIEGYIADYDELYRTDRNLLGIVGDGFIAFDRRVVMVDKFATDGTARGYVTTDSNDISDLARRFEQLKETYGEKVVR